MKQLNFQALITSILICFIPAVIGGLVTTNAVTNWYPTLIKPTLNPPNWVFGPVWTILYILQGVSLYLIRITQKPGDIKMPAYLFFYSQLVLNLLWSVFFFGLRRPMLGLVEIILLDIFVIFTIVTSYRVNKKAAYLLIPYFGWISFATYLNLMIAHLNK